MATLGPAVAALRSSLTLLDSSISILDKGVSDFPRLRKVLQTQQHFELVPEKTLKQAQQTLADEISPAVDQLLSAAETYIKQLARKEQSLKARSELLEGRLDSKQISASEQPIRSKTSTLNRGNGSNETQALRMKRLQQKKDQLQFAIERLELQTKQKQRDLRKSMAFASQEED